MTKNKSDSTRRQLVFLNGLLSLQMLLIIFILPILLMNINLLILLLGFSFQGLNLVEIDKKEIKSYPIKKFLNIYGFIIVIFGILLYIINLFTFRLGFFFIINNLTQLSIYLAIIILMLGFARATAIVDKTYKKGYRKFLFISGLVKIILSIIIIIYSFIDINVVFLLVVVSLILGGFIIIFYSLLWEKVHENIEENYGNQI